MLAQNGLGVMKGLVQQLLYLLVDLPGGLLTAVALDEAIGRAGAVRVLALRTVRQAHHLAHAEHSYHLAGQRRGVLQVVFRACAALAKNDFLSRPSTELALELIDQGRAVDEVTVLRR